MAGYPEGLRGRPDWLRSEWWLALVSPYLKTLARRLGIAGLDMGALATLWILISYTVIWLGRGEIGYSLVPWWVLGLGAVELAALWESFGHSLGQRLARVELKRPDGKKVSFGQRLLHYLLWHVSVLSLVGLVAPVPWHERLAGLQLAGVTAEGRVPRPWWRTSTGLYLLILGAVALVAGGSVTITQENLERLFTEAWRMGKFFRAVFNPDFSILTRSIRDLIVTFFIAIMATVFAVWVSVPLSFLAARNLMRGPLGRLIYTALRGTLSIMRSIEPIVWAIIFLVWVTARRAPFAGVLALWVHSIADLTKLYAERLESIDPGLIEAITATGANRLQVLRYAVVPQIINPYISFTLYRWDINIRMAIVVSLVGGGGIGFDLREYLRNAQYSQAALLVMLIIILVWAIDYLSARLRAKLA